MSLPTPSSMRASLAIAFLVAVAATAAPSSVGNNTNVYQPARRSVRCVFFGMTTVSGSYTLEYGAPEWKAEYEQTFDQMTLGKRMRFGKDQWTTLDTSCALAIGNKEVKPALYYCVLERSKKGDFSLVLLDSEEIRKTRLDPFASENAKGGLSIPLEHTKADGDGAMALRIDVAADSANEKEQSLTIAFGPHTLKARIRAKI